jgi:hypothetical protein
MPNTHDAAARPRVRPAGASVSPKFKLAAGCERRVGFSCRSSFGQPTDKRNSRYFWRWCRTSFNLGGFRIPRPPLEDVRRSDSDVTPRALSSTHVPRSYCNNFYKNRAPYSLQCEWNPSKCVGGEWDRAGGKRNVPLIHFTKWPRAATW